MNWAWCPACWRAEREPGAGGQSAGEGAALYFPPLFAVAIFPLPMSATAFLHAVGLAAERDERWLFRALELTVVPGEVVRVEGPNGSGKTTLLRILAGLDQDYEGEIHWPRASTESRPWREDVLFLGHLPGVKPALSPRENLEWLLALRGRAPLLQVNEALASVGLAGYEDLPTAQLSAGQRRRVALARLSLETAALWILDEPFTAIDREGVAALEARIAAHAGTGGAVLLTTHHPLGIAARSLSLARPGRPS